MWRVWRSRFGWESLCPILLADRWGFVVVMPLAGATVSLEAADDTYTREFCQITSEGKPDDYRWLNGRIVVVDYGLESNAAASERREYYRGLIAEGRWTK